LGVGWRRRKGLLLASLGASGSRRGQYLSLLFIECAAGYVLQELARVQAQRFFVEHSFREAKSECGMADYQVRRWDAWHNHMALVMLGTLFLVKQKKAGRQQWPMLSFNDLVTAFEHLLPLRQLTAEEIADIINKRHYLRQKAKESHARRAQVARE
jgi:SRSO17 transposase